ncbi:hypothetical protein BT96DRAFT_984102 [Gymnopus androsaceus JB14]|uniref:Uncharacterized protein n=1 Tax=Gymnopus androsaceus JB14 TaxID=1447944 RepID=A0A6A4IJD8_9AGAR|nr:hypothetical protein BT96DRAFT_984102 [Gymnopus androsaceus JB14]
MTEKGQDQYIDALDKVSKGVFSARKHHTAVVRDNILDWIWFKQSDRERCKLRKSTTKSDCGIHHPATQRHIIPQKFVARLQEPKFIEKLKSGCIPILTTDFPAFLYIKTPIDENNPEAGLFKGYLLIRIMFGDTNSLGGPSNSDSHLPIDADSDAGLDTE